MNNKDRKILEPYLMKHLNDYLQSAYFNTDEATEWALEAIELLQIFKIKSIDEIKLYIEDHMDISELNDFPNFEEWMRWASSTKGTQNFYTETTSESYMSSGLDDGGISESLGE
jgi:hypothetical protein